MIRTSTSYQAVPGPPLSCPRGHKFFSPSPSCYHCYLDGDLKKNFYSPSWDPQSVCGTFLLCSPFLGVQPESTLRYHLQPGSSGRHHCTNPAVPALVLLLPVVRHREPSQSLCTLFPSPNPTPISPGPPPLVLPLLLISWSVWRVDWRHGGWTGGAGQRDCPQEHVHMEKQDNSGFFMM